MKKIEFRVQGSAPEPYRVIFRKDELNLSATCTCPAGVMGQCCKHRIRIMSGNSTGIVSANINAISEIQSWVCGTNVEKALKEMSQAEQDYENAKNRLSLSKKRLAHSLTNRGQLNV
jgi:hypothetical protein